MNLMNEEQRHKAMIANTSKNTSIECILRKALWHHGIRYFKNLKVLNTHPDIVITKYKIAIFCDGDFWHGKKCDGSNIQHNKEYWSEKIKRNKERDLENTIELRDAGWIVLRFWESDIHKNLDFCVSEILVNIEKRKKVAKLGF